MRHVATAKESSARPDIEDRLTGRYYTPIPIADAMANAVTAASVGCPVSVADPFCGDGRLVVAWLRRQGAVGSLRRLKRIGLWDFDDRAVASASVAVAAELARQGLDGVEIQPWTGNTFSRNESEGYELVLTNPPWEQLKPDSRDAVDDVERYRNEIRAFAAEIAERFPEASSNPRRTIGGYTVNLARAGALSALKNTCRNGQIAIVLPTTIFADQVSSSFRNRFFSEAFVQSMDVYPAELRLFDGVDQAFVTIIARVGQATSSFCIRRHLSNLAVPDVREHCLNDSHAPVPIAVGGQEHEVICGLEERHPGLGWLESDLRFGLRLSRELDETRIADAFVEPTDGIPFVKGRDISRYCFSPEVLPHIGLTKRRIPESAKERRLAWRDVSRPSQKRRVHACILPGGVVTGNSLGIARFGALQENLLETLLAVMNSLVFEIQIRSKLATNHVSQGVIRNCSVPYAIFEDERNRLFFAELLKSGFSSFQDEAKVEIMVAKCYGLNREKFAILLQSFPKLEADEVSLLLSKEAWA